KEEEETLTLAPPPPPPSHCEPPHRCRSRSVQASVPLAPQPPHAELQTPARVLPLAAITSSAASAAARSVTPSHVERPSSTPTKPSGATPPQPKLHTRTRPEQSCLAFDPIFDQRPFPDHLILERETSLVRSSSRNFDLKTSLLEKRDLVLGLVEKISSLLESYLHGCPLGSPPIQNCVVRRDRQFGMDKDMIRVIRRDPRNPIVLMFPLGTLQTSLS
uniref:Uncharacterized protein n=1 Tax=Cucumis melo TaxID=3656 RepID=A0A9I9EIL6_CUCME